MPKYRLSGEIKHPGYVEVEAKNLVELAELLEKHNDVLIDGFKVYDEQSDCLAFEFDGGRVEDEEGNEVVFEETKR